MFAPSSLCRVHSLRIYTRQLRRWLLVLTFTVLPGAAYSMRASSKPLLFSLLAANEPSVDIRPFPHCRFFNGGFGHAHFVRIGGDSSAAWKSFHRGLNPIFQDPMGAELIGNCPTYSPVRVISDGRAQSIRALALVSAASTMPLNGGRN
jgi:hypothetical protein